MMTKKFLLTLIPVFFAITILSSRVISAPASTTRSELKYRTSFGQCPSRTAGSMTLKLIKIFEEKHSLKEIKRTILKDKLNQKHFVSDYNISYDPLKNLLFLKFKCPEPLMRVQIYKEGGLDTYNAILVDGGDLYDPTYEVLLRSEKKLKKELPSLALPVGEMDKDIQFEVGHLMKNLSSKFRNKVSEIIVDDERELTMILSIKGKPSSVFLGNEDWENKVRKLQKIVSYMESKRKIPAIINLTNLQKIVVKFSDKF